MYSNDFHINFNNAIQNDDFEEANDAVMYELGSILVNNRQDFVDLLNESNVYATVDMSDVELINQFIENIGDNNKLMLGASLLTQMQNKKVGFDGNDEIDDTGVKKGYIVLNTYFSDFDDYSDINLDDYTDEEHSQIWGGIISGIGKGIKNLIGNKQESRKSSSSSSSSQKRLQAQRREKERARQQMIAAALAKRKAEEAKKLEEEKKRKRKMWIIGGSVTGVLLITAIVLVVRSKRNKA